jgi:hypothetical protein
MVTGNEKIKKKAGEKEDCCDGQKNAHNFKPRATISFVVDIGYDLSTHCLQSPLPSSIMQSHHNF